MEARARACVRVRVRVLVCVCGCLCVHPVIDLRLRPAQPERLRDYRHAAHEARLQRYPRGIVSQPASYPNRHSIPTGIVSRRGIASRRGTVVAGASPGQSPCRARRSTRCRGCRGPCPCARSRGSRARPAVRTQPKRRRYRCGCGRGGPSLSADVAGVGPGPVRMWQ